MDPKFAGWFISWNPPMKQWTMTGGTPYGNLCHSIAAGHPPDHQATSGTLKVSQSNGILLPCQVQGLLDQKNKHGKKYGKKSGKIWKNSDST